MVEHAPTFSSLRHTQGSALIADGWDIEEVSARLGHSDVVATMLYVHEYEAARRRSERRNRLAALYDAPMVAV